MEFRIKNIKVLIIALGLFVSGNAFAQSTENSSWFGDGETTQQDEAQYSTDTDPGGMGEPVPINGIVPFLLLSSVFLVLYQYKKVEKKA